MDQFDEALTGIEEKVKDLKGMCICAGCPTYNSCANNAQELLYCIFGQSFQCVTEDLGCICPSCPLVSEVGLVNLTFCLLGSEASQRYRQRIGP